MRAIGAAVKRVDAVVRFDLDPLDIARGPKAQREPRVPDPVRDTANRAPEVLVPLTAVPLGVVEAQDDVHWALCRRELERDEGRTEIREDGSDSTRVDELVALGGLLGPTEGPPLLIRSAGHEEGCQQKGTHVGIKRGLAVTVHAGRRRAARARPSTRHRGSRGRSRRTRCGRGSRRSG